MSDQDRITKKQQAITLGTLAEELVAQWLIEQGWQIVQRRWYCRWGELDLVAHRGMACLAFVEVKARRCQNWDQGGLLAITPQKCSKLAQAAALFLADYPEFAALPCRFDVALVQYGAVRRSSSDASARSDGMPVPSVQLRQPVCVAGYQLTLYDYIEAAFEL